MMSPKIFSSDYFSSYQGLVLDIFWVQCLVCLFFCFYVVFASGEGFNWFSFQHNPILLSSAVAGIATMTLFPIFPNLAPSARAVVFASGGWSLYAALVTRQHWPFRRIARHVAPVNLPLGITLLLLYLYY